MKSIVAVVVVLVAATVIVVVVELVLIEQKSLFYLSPISVSKLRRCEGKAPKGLIEQINHVTFEVRNNLPCHFCFAKQLNYSDVNEPIPVVREWNEGTNTITKTRIYTHICARPFTHIHYITTMGFNTVSEYPIHSQSTDQTSALLKDTSPNGCTVVPNPKLHGFCKASFLTTQPCLSHGHLIDLQIGAGVDVW